MRQGAKITINAVQRQHKLFDFWMLNTFYRYREDGIVTTAGNRANSQRGFLALGEALEVHKQRNAILLDTIPSQLPKKRINESKELET